MIIPSLYRKKINILAEFFIRIGQKIFFSIVPISSPLPRRAEGENRQLNGLPFLTTNADGDLQCNTCLICQDICPTKCITIIGKDQKVMSFEINMLKCIYCDLCENHCPIDAIRFSQENCQNIGQAQMGLEQLAYRKTLNNGLGVKTAVARN